MHISSQTPEPPETPLAALLLDQDGVIARRQVIELGLGRADLQRLVRRRELVRVHTGVYVDHTGPLTWAQRARAAVLACAPSALGLTSALRSHEGPGTRRDDSGPVHVLIHRDRHLTAPGGVVLHRVVDLDERVQWNAQLPRDRLEPAVIDIALAGADRMSRLAVLSDAVQSRRTTARRLRDEVERRSRVADRPWLIAVLEDIEAGSCSVLEHGYLVRVERAHGLTGGRRQVRDRVASGAIYRDVEYTCRDGSALVVELDGRLHHDSAGARDRDLDRDLLSAVDGRRTVRLGWGQVYARQCRTAAVLARLLGTPMARCPSCPDSPGGV